MRIGAGSCLRLRSRSRRGITMIETSVACAVGTLLVYLVAVSYGAFARGAALVAARAELVREADLAMALLGDSLREGHTPIRMGPGPGAAVAIGSDQYVASDHVLYRNGEAVAWGVAAVTVSDDSRVIRLRMQDPDRYEDRARTRLLRRDFYLMVPPP